MSEQERTDAATVPPVAAHAATDLSEAENPEVVALKAKLDRLERRDRDRTTAMIRKDAVIFADTVIRAGHAMPVERASIVALYTQAASDDAAQADSGHTPDVLFAAFEADGKAVNKKGTRVDALTAAYNARPSHGMFDNRVTTDPLPDGLSLHGNGSQGTDPDGKLSAAAEEWAEKRNGKPAAKS